MENSYIKQASDFKGEA